MKLVLVVLAVGAVGMVMDANAQLLQQGSKLVGKGNVGASYQGWAVCISGDGNTAAVGGYQDNAGFGAVWAYARNGGAWTQMGTKFNDYNNGVYAYQGESVALSSDGSTLIEGGMADSSRRGAAWVLTRSGQLWNTQAKLVGTGFVGGAEEGYSVSLSSDGNTALVGGAFDNSLAGAAWVFTRSGIVWSQQGGKLVGTGASSAANQGNSVCLSGDGNTAIVGGPGDAPAGAAWIFVRVGPLWLQQGNKLVGTGAVGYAAEGLSVALSSDGNTAVLGGYNDSSGTGAAWVFTRTAGVWTQQGSKLVGTGASGPAYQGNSVALSLDGNTLLVGGPGDNSSAGAVWVFTRSNGIWTQQGTKLVGAGASGNAKFGLSVSLSFDGKRGIAGGSSDSGLIGASWMLIDAQPVIASVNDIAHDQGGYVAVNWNKSLGDDLPSPLVSEYWVWRGINAGAVAGPATILNRNQYESMIARHELNSRTFMLSDAPSGKVPLGGPTYWQYMTSLPVMDLADYSFACPTLADSTPQGIPWRYFFVTARTADPNVFWSSQIDSGYSVDNLPPSAPIAVQVALPGANTVRVNWSRDRTDPDVGYYNVYRATSPGLPLTAATLAASTIDTFSVDAGLNLALTYYYRVVTVDIHGNPSVPSIEVSTNGVTSVGQSARPFVYALSQNYPNPFNPSTEIGYSVPVAGPVTLEVYDVLGHEIATLVNESKQPGSYSVRWSAESVPSGVYYVRMTAGKYSAVRKVLVIK